VGILTQVKMEFPEIDLPSVSVCASPNHLSERFEVFRELKGHEERTVASACAVIIVADYAL
jgi:hypothetical protein